MSLEFLEHGESRDAESLTQEDRQKILDGVRGVMKEHGITCMRCQGVILTVMGQSILAAVELMTGGDDDETMH
jgi:hypothetical protein